jgi:hypothetical protein
LKLIGLATELVEPAKRSPLETIADAQTMVAGRFSGLREALFIAGTQVVL